MLTFLSPNIPARAARRTESKCSLSIFVKNLSKQPIPVGVGWGASFSFPSGRRQQVRLRIPARRTMEGTKARFNLLRGRALGNLPLNDSFIDLDRDSEDQAIAELIDPAARYAFRIKAISPEIGAFRVRAPQKADFAMIDPQFRGSVQLPPQETVKYTVELELFTPSR